LTGVNVAAQASLTLSGPALVFTLPASGGQPAQSFTVVPTAVQHEGLTASVPLYLGGRDRYARQAGHAGVQAATFGLAAGTINVALAARQQVFSTLRVQQLDLVAQQQATANEEHLRVTKAMFDQGTTPRFEVVQAETQLAQAQGQVIHAATAVSQAKASLVATLNLQQGSSITVEEGVPHELPPGDLHSLIQLALDQRPEIASQQALVRAQEANLRLAKANDNASVALQGAVNNGTATLASPALGWSVTVAVTKPIYQGGVTQAQIMLAQAALGTARLNLEKTAQQIALQVAQNVLNVQDAQQALAVAQQGEVEARERARIAVVRFKNGVSLGVEVLDAQTALTSAQTQVVNARYDLQTAVASLRAVLGLLDLPQEAGR
jgi:outer membrane protein TolC